MNDIACGKEIIVTREDTNIPVTISCFLPRGHQFSRHCARGTAAGQQFTVEFGTALRTARSHDCELDPKWCPVFGCKKDNEKESG